MSTCLTGNIEPRGDTDARASARHALRLLFTRGERKRVRQALHKTVLHLLLASASPRSLTHARPVSPILSPYVLSPILVYALNQGYPPPLPSPRRPAHARTGCTVCLRNGRWNALTLTGRDNWKSVHLLCTASRNRHVELGEFTSEGDSAAGTRCRTRSPSGE